MKINRRDNKLDRLLGKKVQIVFKDGDIGIGVLKWNERFTPETPWKPQSYYLDMNGGKLFFRKGHVKSIQEI